MMVAFAYAKVTSDLGWTWRHNQGRIYMHTRLLEEFPTLALQSIYEENVPEYVDCTNVFEAWARRGVDLIVGTSYGHQFCMAPLAAKYPNTIFFAIAGDIDPNVPNWGSANARIYQPTYLAGIIAGHATVSGKVGGVLPMKLPQPQQLLAAFALGVAHANASHEVHVGWTGGWNSVQQEILGTKALMSLGTDVVFYCVDGMAGMKEGYRRGVHMIGFNADHRMLLGENVLASPYFVWGVIYLQVARMVLLGTFNASAVDVFPGMVEGAVALSDPSFLVPRSSVLDAQAAGQAILNGSDPLCGQFRTNTGATVGYPGRCSAIQELNSMMWQPFNVIDHGTWLLPSQACVPGFYAIWADETWNWTCLPCPAGTFSRVVDSETNQTIVCAPCGAGRVSQAESGACDACPPGTAPSAANDSCVPCPADTYSDDGTACTPCSGSLQSHPGADRCAERPRATTNLVIVISVVAASAGISAVLIAWVLFQRHMATAKVLQDAPKGDVAIVFIDVHSSTTLWDRYPEAMSWALNQHNRIIRNLLVEFEGYEVKTVGDAFMVVFQDACQALLCAMRVQEDLLQQHWPLELQQEEACSMRKDQRNALIWNGPRVRTGIHFGAPELVVNRQRGRVDYLGPAVNLAARVESKACGGQTLITEDVRRLIPPEVLGPCRVHSIGTKYFREVFRAVEVFSVLPESLSTRVFVELKENVCLRCEGPTVCPKCDAALDHGVPGPSPRHSWPRASGFRRHPMMLYSQSHTATHESLL
eukprot:EG_transcript_1625